MLAVDFIVQPGIDPMLSVATDRYLMRSVARRPRNAALRVYSFAGEWLSIGRYHLAPEPGQGVCRRICGGQVLPCGDGFIGLSLVLPHRSAFFGDDPLTLAAYQVLNRHVRGFMEACRMLGLPVYYPGRDTVTVHRRAIAVLSFETDEHGAALFEAVIAAGRDFSVLPQLLDRLDAHGAVKAQIRRAGELTSLGREIGRDLSFDEIAEFVRRGYEKQLGVAIEPHALSALEQQAIAAREMRPEEWLLQRRRRADLDCHALMWGQLGAFEVHFAVEQERFIKDAVLAGDFIASSTTVEAIERGLRLCPLEWRAIDGVVNAVLARPESYLLGIGKPRVIADLIVRGAGR